MTNLYTLEAATEYGIGNGVNGTGRRSKVSGFYVLNPQGKRVVAFTGKDAEKKAIERVAYCNEHFVK